MPFQTFETPNARYQVFHDRAAGQDAPTVVFLHGGPGFNTHGERKTLAPALSGRVNALWFDLIGCADSPAISPEKITWQNQNDDIAAIVRHFVGKPVHYIGHCIGAFMTHDLVRRHRDTVGGVTWYAPIISVSDVFKSLIQRSLREERLNPAELTNEQRHFMDRFLSIPESGFGLPEITFVLEMAAKIRGFQELYWTDLGAMERYVGWMTEKPFAPEVYFRIMTDFFGTVDKSIADYTGIPVHALYADDDQIAPWSAQGSKVVAQIPHAKATLIRGGCHWMHFQKTQETAEATLAFLGR
ncbi:MAG TPA: alpha/beta hydrolase [Bdellovibrionota bacterium]|jgi:pimeloyl-ACP methyl ester carboxylesterase|nr:alpha/beta hydrolase [Bdellovibrionota bacterium]